jgi:NTE family protein
VLDAIGGREGLGLPGLSFRSLLRPWRMPSPQLIARIARRPWTFRASVVALTLVPHGRLALTDHLGDLGAVLPAAWPDGLLVCAARADTGARTVFGRSGGPPVRLDAAVAASCAVPGYFRPVEISGVRYLDGAVHSPTNADVLRREDLDLVVVSSPMSASRGRSLGADAPLRFAHHRRLRSEVRALRSAGMQVVVFEPDRALQATMGLDAMAEDRSDRVLRQAFFDAGARATGPLRQRLKAIDARRRDTVVI